MGKGFVIYFCLLGDAKKERSLRKCFQRAEKQEQDAI
jgi:hypothetical protein